VSVDVPKAEFKVTNDWSSSLGLLLLGVESGSVSLTAINSAVLVIALKLVF
jgi:hypothetical protein